MPRMLGAIIATLAFPIALSFAQDVAAQSVRVRGGVGLPGSTVEVALEKPLSNSVSVALGGRLWTSDSDCPLEVPSTCGDEGISVIASVRPYLATWNRVSFAADGEVGWHHFTSDARDGDNTAIVGIRGVALFGGKASGWSVEAGPAFRRALEYSSGGLTFPSIDYTTFDVAVGLAVP